jgi:hypothetical protein
VFSIQLQTPRGSKYPVHRLQTIIHSIMSARIVFHVVGTTSKDISRAESSLEAAITQYYLTTHIEMESIVVSPPAPDPTKGDVEGLNGGMSRSKGEVAGSSSWKQCPGGGGGTGCDGHGGDLIQELPRIPPRNNVERVPSSLHNIDP